MVRGGNAFLLERVVHDILSYYYGMVWLCLLTFEKQERAPLLPEPVRNPSWPAPVGFDIETTGVGPDDIVTVACVWSPDREAACFYGDDFGPVLETVSYTHLTLPTILRV